MTGNLKFLFQYLSRINIKINRNEFAFQVQSHPDFPSLLSIIDTLSFFLNINSGMSPVPSSDLGLFCTIIKRRK